MFGGILIGILVVFGGSLVVCMFDAEVRRDALSVAWTVAAAPMLPVIFLALRWSRRGYRVRRVEPETFQRMANQAAMRGLSISRQGRYLLLITDPKESRRG